MNGVLGSARALVRRGPMPAWRFSGRTPEMISHRIPLMFPGDPQTGRDIYMGRYHLAGRTLEVGGRSPFVFEPPSHGWAQALHGFAWLGDLATEPGELVAMASRTLVEEWITLHGSTMRHDAWSPRTVAARLEAWLTHSDMILRGSQHRFYRQFLHMLGVHRRYLRVMARAMDGDMDHFHVARVLLMADWCLPTSAKRRQRHGARFDRLFERLLLADGGVVTRNGEDLFDLVVASEQIIKLARDADCAVPSSIMRWRDKVRAALAALSHRDGSLAQFHGSGSGRVRTDQVLAIMTGLQDAPGWPQVAALEEASGYRFVSGGNVVVIADVGRPPPVDLAQKATASCMGFEMSCNGARLVMSMGPLTGRSPEESTLARSTAAFSTLIVSDRTTGVFARRFRNRSVVLSDGPDNVTSSVWETQDATGFQAQHDGYASRVGLLHQRGLRLQRDGSQLDGYDRLYHAKPGAADEALPFCLRFHLHPDVDVQTERDGVLLLSQAAGSWRFRCEPGTVQVEASAWFCAPGGMRQTRQLCVNGTFPEQSVVRWRFERL